MKKLLSALLLTPLLSLNAQAADLTVYTYDSFVSDWGPGPQLEKSFEKQCNCDIEFIAQEDGVSIANRLRIERSNTKADVIVGIDDALMEVVRRENLVQPHGLALKGLKPELKWKDTEFVPIDYGYFSFIYDSDKIKKPARSLKELINSSASVIYQDPRTSTPGQGLMLWVKRIYGDQSPEAWKKLAEHTVTVTKGWWEAYSMFLEGGSDYVLSYNTSPAYHMVSEDKENYKAAKFAEGHVAQIEVAAITTHSKNKKLAQKFLNFMVSPEAQKILPVTNWMSPVIENVELPAAFGTLIQPERIGFTSVEVADNRKQWLKEWRRAAAK
ncbi:thiamine ABC transporter substrate binding subunit [Sansalvadorimonas sp. 2012CJ34-2]|uniref:Thiamine-binding periplasmic protein n=1 Tax=Parendozoicomonas callyspongiae TaxID=2942213 RepID=A0ABT0PHS3_9GAMM|nr:thiamine ABC transporter substrate binding subunit [Sansalvadorimonas sp. 2012CJ34-2]MCL6270801.1 thiamine ABC transporter substrate binding subunit [Sansalvadorimonas sp. 2012CJ34-2]